jgi:hypothetical protein
VAKIDNVGGHVPKLWIKMRPKGLPKTGGRQKGTPNRIKRTPRERAQDLGKRLEAAVAERQRLEAAVAGLTAQTEQATQAVQAENASLLPLDHMLAIMRDPTLDQPLRFEAAKACAPYIHAKLAAVEISGPGGSAIAMDHVVSSIAAMSQVERHQMVARMIRDGAKAAVLGVGNGAAIGNGNGVVDVPAEAAEPQPYADAGDD